MCSVFGAPPLPDSADFFDFLANHQVHDVCNLCVGPGNRKEVKIGKCGVLITVCEVLVVTPDFSGAGVACVCSGIVGCSDPLGFQVFGLLPLFIELDRERGLFPLELVDLVGAVLVLACGVVWPSLSLAGGACDSCSLPF